MLNVSFITLGCKVNQFESEAMMELFEKEGFKIIPACDKSDIFIINTCAVTKESDRKSRQLINKAKRINKNAIVVAVGCSVQLNSERISEETSVDIVIGTKNKSEIARLIKEKLDNNKKQNDDDTNTSYVDSSQVNDTVNVGDFSGDNNSRESILKSNRNNIKLNVAKFKPQESFEELSISKEHDKTRANIKIQDGCNQFCSYCIIPYVRGPIRSRNEEDIIKEVKALADNGYKEIVLNGIHLSSFGKDLKKEDALISIIEKINSINGIERIRFGSLEPNIITDSFMQRLSSLDKICDHFHLSLQSGSDTVLQRMNRRYTASEYMEKVELIRKYMPNVGITTDIIVGFPGETEEEFNETLDFVKKISFSRIHVFKYSVREGTKAASLENQVDEKIKSERSKILIGLADEMVQNFMQKMLGKTISVLIEKKNDNSYEGYTTNYLRTMVESDLDIENQIVKANVISFDEDCLISVMTKGGSINA